MVYALYNYFKFTIIDDLDENQYEVTWGNKKTKYFYSYNLQSPDLFSNINDSDKTENVYSPLKTTSNNFYTNINVVDFCNLNSIFHLWSYLYIIQFH